MDGVSDDNNFTNVLKVCSFIDATPNSKEFGFSFCDVNCVINNLNNLLVLNIDISH